MEEHMSSPQSTVPRYSNERSAAASLWVLFLVALTLRLGAWALFAVNAPDLHGDEGYYTRVAQSIAAGKGHPGAYRPPLYPALIALVFKLGGNLNHVRGLQVTLSLVGIWLIFDLTRRQFGHRAGICAGWMAAVAPPLVHYCHFLWSESLAAFWLTLFLWLMTRSRRDIWWFACAGVVLGLLALTREVWLYLAPFAIWWIVFQRLGQATRRRWWAAIVFVLAMGTTIAPWSWRNYRYFNRWVTVSTNHWMPIAVGNRSPEQQRPYRGATNKTLRRMVGHLDELEEDRAFRGIALEAIKQEQPWWLGKKVVTNTPKLFSVWNQSLRFISEGWISLSRPSTGVLVAYDVVGTLIVVGLGLVGLAVLNGSGLWPLAMAAVSLKFVVHILANATSRFLVPLVPVFAVFAGVLVASGRKKILRKKNTTRIFVVTMAYLIAAFAPIYQRLGNTSEPQLPKNVILVSIDTLRADHLGCYGYHRPTSPTLDDLARRGTLFENFVSPTGWTLPGHASMLTGLAPARHGAIGNGTSIKPEVTLLAELLKDTGYSSVGIVNGPYVSERFGFSQGFDSFTYIKKPRWREHQDAVLESIASAATNQPFFGFYHYMSVHLPYDPPAEFDRFTRPYDGSIPTNGALRNVKEQMIAGNATITTADRDYLIDRYDGGILHVDSLIRELVEALETSALGPTVLIVTSDHGEHFMEHGKILHNDSLYDELLRVPFIIVGPGISVGKRISTMAGLIDVVPTVLGVTGLEIPENVEGQSLINITRGHSSDKRAMELLTSMPDGDRMLRGFRSSDTKFIVNLESGIREFYDLSADPGESQNLAKGRDTRRLEQRLQALVETAEPLTPLTEKEVQDLKALGYME
jgi:arylsulfatase A-like enzyme/4-amino-4-deoxy-L-arabinose transferase-like glycosyltransferase